jgi:hypothetical protein
MTSRGSSRTAPDLNKLGEWVFENEMIINSVKSKAVCLMKA